MAYIDPAMLPSLSALSAPADVPKRNLLAAGLSAGVDELQGLLGSAIQAGGKLSGFSGVEDFGRRQAERNVTEAAANGRPDLEIAPWHDGGASVLPWLAYQATKQVPLIAGAVGAGAVMPEAVIPAGLARLGAIAPRVLGGGALEAGAGFAARRAALATGNEFARAAVGGFATGLPLAVGSMYQEADAQPGGATTADAAKAFALSPVYAALDAFEPAQLKGLLTKGLKGNIVKRVATAGIVGAAAEAPQEAVQTALEQSFRPDLSQRDKINNIVEAAITGGAVGGVLGGVGGVRRLKMEAPNAITNEALLGTIEQELAGPQAALPAPDLTTNAQGETFGQAAPTEDLTRPHAGQTDEELSAALGALANKRANGGLTQQFVELEKRLQGEASIRAEEQRQRGIMPTEQTEMDLVPPAAALKSGTQLDMFDPAGYDQIGARAAAPVPVEVAAPVEPDFSTKLTEIKKGLGRNDFVHKLDAANDADLLDKVYTQLTSGDERKGTYDLAQRVGLYDGDFKETPLFAEVAARQAPAAPVEEAPGQAAVAAPEFASAWAAMTKNIKDPAIRALNPTDMGDLEQKVYTALAGPDRAEVGDRMETLGKKLGLLDAELNLTDKAKAIALKDTIPTETAIAAAIEQGYSGQDAAIFERGVQAAQGKKPLSELKSFADMKAFQDGQAWAASYNVPAVAPNRATSPNGEVSDEQLAAIASNRPISMVAGTVPVEARAQQAANVLIDSAGFEPSIQESEIAGLKQMAREGTPVAEIQQAIDRVKAGGSLFTQPAAPPPGSFTPVVVDRGAPRVAPETTVTLGQSKRAQRAETARAVSQRDFTQRQALLNDELKAAFDSQDIDRKSFIALSQKLRQGDHRAVIQGLPGRVMERLGEGDKGVSLSGAKAAIKRVSGSWKTTTNVEVHASIDDVPTLIRDQLTNDNVLGFYATDSDTVHIVAGNHATYADVVATLYHEMLGHRGLRAAFGQRLDTLLHDIYRTNIGVRNLADEYLATYGKWADMSEVDQQISAVEEVLAAGSEGGRVTASAWERVVSAIRQFGRKLGLDIKYSAGDVQAIMARAHDAAIQGAEIDSRGSVPVINERLKDTMAKVTQAADSVNLSQQKASFRKAALGWSSLTHLVTQYGKLFSNQGQNGLGGYEEALNYRRNVGQRLGQMFSNAYDKYAALPKEAAELTRRLMGYTIHDIDPARNWDQHSWLHGDPALLKTDAAARAREAKLKALVAGANGLNNQLRRNPAHGGAYEDFKAVNQATHYATTAMSMFNMVASDEALKGKVTGFAEDPMEKFVATSSLHEQPSSACDYWRGVLAQQAVGASSHIDALRGANFAAGLTDKQRTKLEQQRDLHLSPLEERLKTLTPVLAAGERAPYFHLGRFGDYIAAFSIRLGADKRVDPAATDHVAEALKEAGFGFATISTDVAKPGVFIRLDDVSQADSIKTLLGTLKRQGWLDADKEVRVGKRSEETITQGIHPEWLDKMVARIKADDALDAKEKQHLVDAARDTWLDMLPDSAVAKVMAHRDAVPGFDQDMVRAFAHRARVGIYAVAGLSAAPRVTEAFANMRGAIKASETDPAGDASTSGLMTDIVDELSLRRDQASQSPKRSVWDTVRALNHTFFLGASPSYTLVNMTQLGVLLWPELAKKHGFAKAGGAIAKVTPTAFRVMKAVFAEGKAIGLSRAADAIVTEKALTRAGVDEKTAAFIMKMVNTGAIDIGSAIRELGRVSEGSDDTKTDKALRYAGAMGYYSETLTRLIAALSARDLHGDKPGAAEYAATTVNQSMLNYAQDNIARQTGKLGVAGPFTPVMFSFMQYTFQLTEKLYREFYAGVISKDATAQEKTEARRFLGAHLAAMTVIAGTLGMPMASVLSRAAEKLVDLFDDDDEPYDIQAAYRNFLSDMFGKGVGEVLARGAPRALGFDLSSRAGEQDLLPFSRALTDKRKLEDVVKDQALHTLGSPASMFLSIATGARDMMNGDVIGGAKKMVPLAIKGPIEAFRMSDKGYVDTQGNKLPMTPGASAILLQALGLNPAPKAEYTEAKGRQTAREGQIVREGGLIRKGLAIAIEDGDQEAAREWLARARSFDAANPAHAVLGSIGGTISSRAKARAISSTLSLPIGANYQDDGARGLTRYANFQ